MVRQLALLLLLLVVLCAVSVRSNQPAYYPNPYSVNATACFHSMSEECCNGIVHPKSRLEKCCGQGVYKPARQRCCNGVIHDIKIGFECCGNVTYDIENKICCNSYVIDSDDAQNPNLGCCGEATYDITKQKCCHAYPDIYKISDTENPNSLCCGDKLYDQNIEFCCIDYQANEYVVHNIEENNGQVTCCGSEPMDVSNQACCGNIIYNINEQTCCYGSNVVVPISKPGEICCDLAGKGYDAATQLCCGDKVKDNEDNNLACCGNQIIDVDEEICCWLGSTTQPIKKESPEHNSCCGDKPYCLNTHLCCQHENEYAIQPNREGKTNYGCCGINKYDFANDLCCGANVFKKSPSEDQCCGDAPINSKKQTCCWNYDHDTGKSNWTLIDDYKPNSFCCGSEIYTQGTNKGCCHNKIYDEKTEVCCGSRIISKKGKNYRDTCCYPDSPNNTPYPIITLSGV